MLVFKQLFTIFKVCCSIKYFVSLLFLSQDCLNTAGTVASAGKVNRTTSDSRRRFCQTTPIDGAAEVVAGVDPKVVAEVDEVDGVGVIARVKVEQDGAGTDGADQWTT
jgi:hypothetical protein